MDMMQDTKPPILGQLSEKLSSPPGYLSLIYTLSSPQHQVHLHRPQTPSSPGEHVWYALPYSWAPQSSPVCLASYQVLPHTPFYIIARALQGRKRGKKHSRHPPTWARSAQAPPSPRNKCIFSITDAFQNYVKCSGG